MGVVLRYEWPEPDAVRWTLLESNFCDQGEGELRIRPGARGGAQVDIVIEERAGKGALGSLLLGVKGLLGPSVLRRTSRRALDRVADEGRPAG